MNTRRTRFALVCMSHVRDRQELQPPSSYDKQINYHATYSKLGISNIRLIAIILMRQTAHLLVFIYHTFTWPIRFIARLYLLNNK